MCERIKYKIFLYILLAISVSMLCGFTVLYMVRQVPDTIMLKEDDSSVLDLKLPFTGEINKANVDGSYISSVNFNYPVAINTGDPASYNVKLKLFGFIYYKDINIDVVPATKVYACGYPIGVYLKSDGVLVVDNASFTTIDGSQASPCAGILKMGDYILSINDEIIDNKIKLLEIIAKSNGEFVNVKVRRNNEEIVVRVKPQKDSNGEYKIGLWIRDDAQGIGTLTFIDEEGNFGALGHGISDNDTGKIFDIDGGILYKTSIVTVVKGQAGAPGEYVGTIDYSTKNQLGLITKNTKAGIFGIINPLDVANQTANLKTYEVGYKFDLVCGDAYIISGTDNNTKLYKIRIDAIDYTNNNINKGIEFTVVDTKLLDKTNGVVQGMSGAPIIQNGKIIGAVTHVLVNDPTKGYGIFIENMISSIN